MPNQKKPWYEFKQLATNPDTLQLYIYSEVMGDYWDWDAWEQVKSETSAEYFAEQLNAYPNAKQIDIYINSLGGSCYEGNGIYAMLNRHPAHKTVYIDGSACSIASVIAMAGDEIIMSRNAVMMIHNAWTSIDGNSTKLRQAADQLDKLNAAARQAYLSKCGDKLDEKALIKLMDNESYLTAAECIAYGLADKYSDTDGDANMSAANIENCKMLSERLAAAKAAAIRGAGQTPESKTEQPEKAKNEPMQKSAEEIEQEKAEAFRKSADDFVKKFFNLN